MPCGGSQRHPDRHAMLEGIEDGSRTLLVDENPVLIVFGFDEDQKNGDKWRPHRKKLKTLLDGRVHLKGDSKGFARYFSVIRYFSSSVCTGGRSTLSVEGPNYVSESRGRAGKRQGQSLPVSPLRTAAMPLAGVELQSLASSVVGGVRRFQLADTGLLSQNLHRPDDGAGQARSRIVIDAGPPHDHRQLMDSSGGWVVE